jgi:hypothetical protein
LASQKLLQTIRSFHPEKNHKTPKSKHKWSVVYQSLKRGVGGWVRGLVGAQERQDKTILKTRKDLLLFVPQHFFWPKKSTTHKQKSALS